MAVCCGSGHAAVVTEDGQIYTWGNSAKRGQLGRYGEAMPETWPMRVDALANELVLLACGGGSHTAAVGERGELWTWGHGGYGALGQGDLDDRRTPARVGAERFEGKPVIFAAGSYYHTGFAHAATKHSHSDVIRNPYFCIGAIGCVYRV